MNQMARQERSALQPTAPLHTAAHEPVAVGVNAAILAVEGDEPVIATLPAGHAGRTGNGDSALPCGLFSPSQHGSLEAALRACVQQQTGVELASVRQICAVAGHGHAHGMLLDLPVVAVSYLALVDRSRISDCDGMSWRSWYAFFPWEDWRRGKPACLREEIEPRLMAWARLTPVHCEAEAPGDASDRSRRVRIAFGCDGATWDEEKTLERYQLLDEAGFFGETAPGAVDGAATLRPLPRLQHPMLGDHAGVLARAIGDLRRSVKCQPVVFELMPEQFTLFELQKTVQAILGPNLHKQNFRRLVETGGLVEPTGEFRLRTGGRPAQLYRFRRDVLLERPAPGVRIKGGRG
jgi:hypothetical protein